MDALQRAQNGALDVIARLEYAKANAGGMITAHGLELIDETLRVFNEKWKAAYDAQKMIDGIRAGIVQP